MIGIAIYLVYAFIFILVILSQINLIDEFKSDKSLWKKVIDKFILMIGLGILGYMIALIVFFTGLIESDTLLIVLIFEGTLIFLSVINVIMFIIAYVIKCKKIEQI